MRIESNEIEIDNEKDELNENQRQAVEYFGEKPLLIEAGPGSGKTRVIVERVNFLINKKHLDPSSFLIITFTRKAASELRIRLKDFLTEEQVNQMQISTIHSFCSELLKEKSDEKLKVLDDDYNIKKSMFIYQHRDELGFDKELKLKLSKVREIVSLFNEFSTFKLIPSKLEEYVKTNFPVSPEYKEFVRSEIETNGRFPERKIKDFKKLEIIDDPEVLKGFSNEELEENERNRELKKYQTYWDNSILLQTVKAYPEYLNILKKYKFLDYGILQTDALNCLEKKSETQYKNVLIDEFQDTDPIQYKIFEILLKEIIKDNKENPDNIKSTFTVVGDIDQSIYRFRGAYEDYFASLESLDFTDAEKKFLDINYRSTVEIIRFSDNYIKHQRDRVDLKPNEKKIKSRNIYYLENENRDDEAVNIRNIVLKLKNENIIKDYKDIAILFKSVTNDSKKIAKEFDQHNIPYQVSEMKELEKKDEIKFILTMMNFIIDSESDYIPVILDNKLPWFRLTKFKDDSKVIFKISNETKQILKDYHKDFEKEVIKIGKEEYKKLYDEEPDRRSLSGIFKLDEEVLENTFKRVEIPLLTNEELIDLEITNEKDLEFFRKLNEIKDNVFNQSYEERYTILEIYYKLLEICGYLNYEFVSDESNSDVIDNLALLSNIIFDYEETVSRKNIFGLYFYLTSNMRHIGKDSTNKTGVNLMTVHKAKGLEFPVVIIAGINDNKFPKDYNYLAKKSPEIYNTPNFCLEYKNETEEEELLNHNKEEERVLYVAMTRAEDLLILSKDIDLNMRNKDIITIFDEELEELKSLDPTEEVLDEIRTLEENKRLTIQHKARLNDLIEKSDCIINIEADEIDQLDFNPPIEIKDKDNDKKSLTYLSHSSTSHYEKCPFSYYLSYRFNLKRSANKGMVYGTINHNSLEYINNLILSREDVNIDKNFIRSVVEGYVKEYEFDEASIEPITENLNYYWNEIGSKIEVLESEYDFRLIKSNHILNGSIDLIYKLNDKIHILDYKTGIIDEEDQETYKNQLYTYALALKEDPKYKDSDFGKLQIYSINYKDMFDIEIEEEKLAKREKEIEQVADNILKKKFKERAYKGDEIPKVCSKCMYRFMCIPEN